MEHLEASQRNPLTPTIPVTELSMSMQAGLAEIWRQIGSLSTKYRLNFNRSPFEKNRWCEPKNFAGTSFVGILLAIPEPPKNVFVRAGIGLGAPFFAEAVFMRYKAQGVNRRISFTKEDLSGWVGPFWLPAMSEDREVFGIRKKLTYSGPVAVQTLFSEESRKLLRDKDVDSLEGDDCPWSLIERRGLYTILVMVPGEKMEHKKLRKNRVKFYNRKAIIAFRCTESNLHKWGIKPPGPAVTGPSPSL